MFHHQLSIALVNNLHLKHIIHHFVGGEKESVSLAVVNKILYVHFSMTIFPFA